jgi:hypothetical protein
MLEVVGKSCHSELDNCCTFTVTDRLQHRNIQRAAVACYVCMVFGKRDQTTLTEHASGYFNKIAKVYSLPNNKCHKKEQKLQKCE